MELYFVTSNKGKADEVEKILGLPIKTTSIELPEIQSLDLIEIVEQKVRKAYEEVEKPVFVDDAGLFVEAWNGFPGPFVKFMRLAGKYDNDLLLRMMENETNRRATARSVIGYFDGRVLKTFTGEVRGILIKEERGRRGWGFDSVFQPDGYNKSFSELGEKVKNTISHRYNALKKFASFLQELC